jgi:hypothetical protein
MHHPGYLESAKGWFVRRKKQALDLSSQFYILEEVVTLLLNSFDKRFPLFHIPLDEINDNGETQQRGEIVEGP